MRSTKKTCLGLKAVKYTELKFRIIWNRWRWTPTCHRNYGCEWYQIIVLWLCFRFEID